MVGGPGMPFDTSTAVGQADAACRFLQALAAQDGYAQTASTEAPAQRAHLLRAGEAARHVCSLTDSRHSNDQFLSPSDLNWFANAGLLVTHFPTLVDTLLGNNGASLLPGEATILLTDAGRGDMESA